MICSLALDNFGTEHGRNNRTLHNEDCLLFINVTHHSKKPSFFESHIQTHSLVTSTKSLEIAITFLLFTFNIDCLLIGVHVISAKATFPLRLRVCERANTYLNINIGISSIILDKLTTWRYFVTHKHGEYSICFHIIIDYYLL